METPEEYIDKKTADLIAFLFRKEIEDDKDVLTPRGESAGFKDGIKEPAKAYKNSKPAAKPTKKSPSAMMKHNPKDLKSLIWEIEVKLRNGRLVLSEKYAINNDLCKIDIPQAGYDCYINIEALFQLIKGNYYRPVYPMIPRQGKDMS